MAASIGSDSPAVPISLSLQGNSTAFDDQNSFYLGLEFLLGALVIGGAVLVVTKFFPRVKERWIAVVVGALLGLFLMLRGVYGLPEFTTVATRLKALVPYTAAALWMFMALRFWLSARAHRINTTRQIGEIPAAIRKAVEPLEGDLQRIREAAGRDREWTRGQLEFEREALRKELIQLWESQGAALRLAIESEAATASSRVIELGQMLIDKMNERAQQEAMWEGSTRAALEQHGVSIKSIKEVIDLLSREVRLTPERLEAAVRQIRGPEHTVTHNGVTAVKSPKYPNIKEVSEQLDKVTNAVAELIKTVEAKKTYYQRGVEP